MRILERTCRRRTQVAVPYSRHSSQACSIPRNIEVEVGGAIVFVMNVNRFERL